MNRKWIEIGDMASNTIPDFQSYLGSLHVHWTNLNFKYSSMIGLAMQLAPKSAANNVILFGLYCFSRNTHGKIIDGTLGVKENI